MSNMDRGGRGPIAVQDMKNRIAAGWTFEQLWDRMYAAEMGGGYVYDMAEALLDPNTAVESAEGSGVDGGQQCFVGQVSPK